MKLVPNARLTPPTKVTIHGFPRRKVMRQHPPTSPCPQHVQDGVNDFTARVAGWTSAGLHRRDEGLDLRPLPVTQITGICFPFFAHAPSLSLFKHPHALPLHGKNTIFRTIPETFLHTQRFLSLGTISVGQSSAQRRTQIRLAGRIIELVILRRVSAP